MMNRFRRDGLSSRSYHDGDDEEKLYERQALISDEELNCDSDSSPSRAPLNRRHASKQSLELRNIQKSRDPTGDLNGEFTYYDIQPGDSLHNICLRYARPINQVKRLNGLMIDQEFYGLRRLKLPLGKLGLLEDVLRNQNNNLSANLIQMSGSDNNAPQNDPPKKFANSPGSALSVTNGNRNFKPLLSPGYSSDNVSRLQTRVTRSSNENRLGAQDCHLQHNPHSFSSLREFERANDKNISIDLDESSMYYPHPSSNGTTSRFNTIELREKSFIKTNVDDAQISIDAMLTDSESLVPNVFEDLDFHVERAKIAAETYDKRAAELTDQININTDGLTATTRSPTTQASKIPELFFSGENFGLNLTKLVALIFFICLVVPLVYMNQVNVTKKQL